MWWLRLFLLLFLWSSAGAQPTEVFRVLPLDISVQDSFDRPYRVADNTAYVGVRLAQDEKQQNAEVAKYETLSSAGIEYPRQTQEYVKFPVVGGVARVQFVIFSEVKTPVDYELTLIQDNQFHPLSPAVWSIGTESTQGEVKAEGLRAPHSGSEMAVMVVFALAGAALSYWLLGRVLFTRMLKNRNMEVGTAVAWSNLCVLLAISLVALGVGTMIFFPFILWQKLYWIYVVVPVACLAVVGVLYGLGHFLTRA